MPASQSALSVLSGVHRKDVRTLLAAGRPPARPGPGVPLATQVFTHWLRDPALRDAAGQPRPLPRSGPAPSFDALSRSLSTDVHPRTVLDELLRLGVVELRGDEVVPQAAGVAATGDLAGRAARFSANGADHLAAAVHNLSGGLPLFLEDAVATHGLTREAVGEIAELAQRLWAQAAAAVAEAGCSRSGAGGAHRVRFGAYFYAQAPEAPEAPPLVTSRGGRRRPPRADAG